VAEALVRDGHAVVVLDDLSGGFATNVPADARFVEGSVLDVDLVGKLFGEYRFDFVFHLAAYAAEGLSHFIRRFNYTNNLVGSVNLVNASVNVGTVRCFVFTSSIAVYGANQLPMTEEMVPAPEDPYGIAKYAVEQDLREARNMFGLNYLVFRPHNVYGERQNIGDPYRNVIGIFMNQILQGKPMTVFGDGGQSRAFTYVGDVAPLVAASVSKPEAYNQVFNIGSDTVCNIKELAWLVADAMRATPQVRYLDARKEVVHAFSSHEKLKRFFPGCATETPLKDGLSRMADWARGHGSRVGRPFQGVEVSKNMPESWRRTLA